MVAAFQAPPRDHHETPNHCGTPPPSRLSLPLCEKQNHCGLSSTVSSMIRPPHLHRGSSLSLAPLSSMRPDATHALNHRRHRKRSQPPESQPSRVFHGQREDQNCGHCDEPLRPPCSLSFINSGSGPFPRMSTSVHCVSIVSLEHE